MLEADEPEAVPDSVIDDSDADEDEPDSEAVPDCVIEPEAVEADEVD